MNLLNDIETVMQKYDDMKAEYENMRNNYDEVVKLFNKKVKNELDVFGSDLSRMSKEVKRKPTRNYGMDDEELDEIGGTGEEDPDMSVGEARARAFARRWRIEREDLRNKLNNREKTLSEKETQIEQLKIELKTTLSNNKTNRIR
ncbi:hypothetical protein AKO1_000854, partial [Acrasis kona]